MLGGVGGTWHYMSLFKLEKRKLNVTPVLFMHHLKKETGVAQYDSTLHTANFRMKSLLF